MRRREFIAGLGGAAAWPVVARAQQGGQQIRRVAAVIGFAKNDPEVESYVRAFDEGLRERGWFDGRNVAIDYRYPGNIDEMRRFAREAIATQPDIIFAGSTPVTTALHRETRTIPIVFATVSDPVGAGLVASLSRPGGNVTGLINVEASMSGKWVELLNEVAPGLRRVAMMFNPDTAPGGGSYFVQAFESAARSFGLDPIMAPIHEDPDIEHVIAELGEGQERGGLVIVTDSFALAHRATIIAQASRSHVPAVSPTRTWTKDGGLMSYGPSNIDLFRRAASYVDRILRGDKPSDLPVEVPIKFELFINLKAAKALGLNVPPSLLARADEVIE
jgi:putative ABC transport system substrate-binding protein